MTDRPCEVIRFQCKLVYAYKIPAPGSTGHRAELWDVDNPDKELALKVISVEDDCYIQLFEGGEGTLFAECPVPRPETSPLHTAVTEVVDSSRFFVLKLQDRALSKHAFIGIGFLTRAEASDFSAAVNEYLQSLRRSKAAALMREEYLAQQAEKESSTSPESQNDLRLQEGQRLNLKLRKAASSSKWAALRSSEQQMKPVLSPGVVDLKVSKEGDGDNDWGDFEG